MLSNPNFKGPPASDFIPRILLYIHGPEMKEFVENFDELRPIVLKYRKDIAWVSIVGIEKKVLVNLPQKSCTRREKLWDSRNL